ncbi:MAG: sensor histidine kinase [Flavobacteriales bacterium]|nr:sensor histidine kinase [Flavobacteriales bacterium]
MKKIVFWLLANSLVFTLTILLVLAVLDKTGVIHFLDKAVQYLYLGLTLWILVLLLLAILLVGKIRVLYKTILDNPFNENQGYETGSFNPLTNIIKSAQNNNNISKFELERLNTLERYRKEYIGNVSHELKTPIFNIQGYISSLLEGALEDEAVNRQFLEKAEKNVDRMTNIVMDLQTISRLEAGELELNMEVFQINELIEDVIETESENAAKSNVAFVFEPSRKFMVEADKFRIRQVLTNLLVNSIRYSKPGGGQTSIRIYDLDRTIRIEISDNGIGMDKKHLNRIFERFYRVDSSRSREKGGSGLGLAIVKHIIEAHGENIEVLSTPNVGTAFNFSLKKAHKDTNG